MNDTQPAISRLLGLAVAVRDLGAAVAAFERLGLACSDRAKRPEWGLDSAQFAFDNGSYLELVTPIDPDNAVGATVAAYLAKRGEGTYLATFEVEDMTSTHARLTAAGVPLAGPPRPAPASTGTAAVGLWLKPRATGGGFTQLLSFPDGAPKWPVTTPDTRVFNQVYAVHELASATHAFEAAGHRPWARYRTADWGLDTLVYKLSDDTHIEVVSPRAANRPVAQVVAKAIADRGPGHYMTVLEVPDVDATAERLEANGVRLLGAPTVAPPEGPWGPCRQLWVHPQHTHGCFVEFVTAPGRNPGDRP